MSEGHDIQQMSIEYAYKEHIQKFIRVKKIDLKIFCDHLLNKIHDIRKARPVDLEYSELEGNNRNQKIIDLINKVGALGYYTDFIFILTNYWLEHEGLNEEICNAGIHHALCLAAQNLWCKNSLRKFAIQAFNRISNLHEGFRLEWQRTENGEVLKNVANLGAYKTVEDLTALLSRCRKLYEKATNHRENHQWIDARKAFIELNNILPGYHDVSFWVKCLRNENDIRCLQNIIDAAEAGFIYDDRIPWEVGYPYRLFQSLDNSITPHSSMDQIQTILLHSDIQKKISSDQLSQLEVLMDRDHRLFVDSFLYPLCPSKEEAYHFEALFIKEGCLPAQKEIKKQFPQTAGIILLLVGLPEEASTMFEESQRSHPRSGKLAHLQGLLHLAWAFDKKEKKLDTILENWRQAISHWAIALADTTYWIEWGLECSKYYEQPFLVTPIIVLARKIQNHLRDLCKQIAEQESSKWADEFRKLDLELLIEFEAVRLSKELGGIKIGQGRKAWFGPIWMSQFGLNKAVAENFAEFVPDYKLEERLHNNLTIEETLRRLRWYFSYLRTAAILLDGPDPDPRRAIESMNYFECDQAPDCGDPKCPLHAEPKFPEKVCCLHWSRFHDYNPAYTEMERNQVQYQICDDALHFAIEAHLRLALLQIDSGKMKNRETWREEWEKVFALAKYSQDTKKHTDILAKIRMNVMVATLLPARTQARAQLDEAIALMELYRSTLLDEDQMMKIRLAELLALRGKHKYLDKNQSGAEEDLRRALNFAPHIVIIRIELAIMWEIQARNIHRENRYLALELLRRAEELIRQGMKLCPDPEYEKTLREIKKTQDGLSLPETTDEYENLAKVLANDKISRSSQLFSRGIREICEEKTESALDTLSQALEITPDDEILQNTIVEEVLDMALWLIEENGDQKGAIELVKQWQEKLTTQKELPQQVDFLRQWSDLRKLLNNLEIFYKIKDFQEVLLPFESPNIGTLLVHLRFEDDNLCFTAPLPSFSSTWAETILYNLLQTSREMMIFKVVAPKDADLELKGIVPLRMLQNDQNLLHKISFSIFRYADMLPEKLNRINNLRNWFQERRAALVQYFSGKEYLQTNCNLFEDFCRKKKLSCRRQLLAHYQVDNNSFGIMDMEASSDGVRFSVPLGFLPKEQNRLTMLRELIERNTFLKLGKLALAENQALILSVEFPYLDKKASGEAFEFLTENVPKLKRELLIIDVNEESKHE